MSIYLDNKMAKASTEERRQFFQPTVSPKTKSFRTGRGGAAAASKRGRTQRTGIARLKKVQPVRAGATPAKTKLPGGASRGVSPPRTPTLPSKEVTTAPATKEKKKGPRETTGMAIGDAAPEVLEKSTSTHVELSSSEAQLQELDSMYKYSRKHDLCLDILCAGHVQSFVEFFHLTHFPVGSEAAQSSEASNRPPVKAQDSESQPLSSKQTQRAGPSGARGSNSTSAYAAEGRAVVPVTGLDVVGTNLQSAEVARRAGDSVGIFDAYTELAQYFETLEDNELAIYFHSKAFAVAKESDDIVREFLASNSLGEAYDRLMDTPNAIKYFEQCLALSRQLSGEDNDQLSKDQQDQANAHLKASYTKFAHDCERQGDAPRAMMFFKKALEIAQLISDRQAEADISHHLGLVCETLKDPIQAARYHGQYLKLCKELGDVNGEQAACSVLARAHKEQGDLTTACKYLDERRKLAQRDGNVEAEAAACRDLGLISSTQGDHAMAARYLASGLKISLNSTCTNMPAQEKDLTRVGLGIARATTRMNEYVNAVLSAQDGPALYSWRHRARLEEGLPEEKEPLAQAEGDSSN